MEAPAVAPVAEAKGFGSLSFNSVKEMAKNYSDNVKAKAKNTVAEHTALIKGEISQLGNDITGKVKGINLGGLFSKGAAPAAAAAAGGRRTRRRKSSRKSKGKSTKRSKRSRKSRKSKTNNKKKSKRVRFSLRRR